MSVRVITWAFAQKLPSTTKLVLVALADYADEHGQCWPGQVTLAEKCGLTERAVRTHIEALKAMGLVVMEYRRDSRGRPMVSRYTLAYSAQEEAKKNTADNRNIVPPIPEQYSGTFIVEPSLTSTHTGGTAAAASATIPVSGRSDGIAEWHAEAEMVITDPSTGDEITVLGDWGVDATCYAVWASLFPAVDIDLELDRAAKWYRDNPRRHKRNTKRFLTNWMARAQKTADDRKAGRKIMAPPKQGALAALH